MSTATTDEHRSTGPAGITYITTSDDYFEKRQLKRTAGVFGLWAIGISAVISGDFSGWNGGIAQAGWGGMLIAALVVYAMYVMMLNSISEMASAMPHTGGAYSFARAAMGPWGGFFTGLAETIEYVMTAATIVYFSSAYADAILSDLTGYSLTQHGLQWVWWLILYIVFVVVNWLGAETSFHFAQIISVVALAIVAVFGIGAIVSGAIDFSSLLNIKPEQGDNAFLPFGAGAIFYAMPFAMWLFLGIEQLPLAAEEVRDPERNIPKASRWCIFTLGLSALVIVFLNPAVVGSKALAGSDEPLLDGYRAILPGNLAAVLSAFALIGLLASIQGIMFAYGRNLYSLSRAGYYPAFLSLTGKKKTPYWGLIVGAVIGFAALFIIAYGGSGAGSVVLNIAVWGAVLAYLLQMVSFVLLRRRMPDIKRPFISKYGVAGAVVSGLLALVIFVAVLFNPDYRLAVYAMVAIYLVATAFFALYGRKHLVLSPEEEFAASGGVAQYKTE
ncbi:amino acid permease [Bifidobacterium subtile]|jgi:ethanolamine permease|nr:amino acid permease [Bifidobacterium subtile]MCI1222750.1 amino acid permease [Bifidobacterium subtile]MCI1240687.1 amino acid permease [Bifidobacterium subtile]MCI1257728.1 amino acid permease [Bifidobacterium subtile]QOL35905.1 amino acid permease [Bifidobacterium subtile]